MISVVFDEIGYRLTYPQRNPDAGWLTSTSMHINTHIVNTNKCIDLYLSLFMLTLCCAIREMSRGL